MESPTINYLKGIKGILQYVKGTINLGLFDYFSNSSKLVGYNDSNWARDYDDKKSTIRFVFFI